MRMKVALITAGSGGIGRAIVDLFLENNYSVVVTGRSLEKLHSVFSSYTTNVFFVECDVTNPISCHSAVESTVKHFGQLDVLVNNAGGASLKQTFENGSLESLNDAFALNVNSVFFMTQHAIPYLTETRGSIINFSSVLGSRPVAGLGAYCASKAAVEMLTKTAALELAAKKIRVNCVAPSATQTEFHVNAGMSEEQAKFYYESCARTHPLGRVGKTSDISELVLFLADSNKAGYMTGSVIPVDGGRLLTSSSSLHS